MRNEEIFEASKKYMPGGVNSPVRAYKDVNLNPPVIKKGEGAYVFDEDGKRYIDFVCAWGPMILGHCDKDVVNAISETCKNSIAFGAPTSLELELAKFMCTTLDNLEMIRMVNSGTEATMSAVKLARGYTNRSKIVKFAGMYHGHFESFLVSAGSGVLTNGIPGSAGVPKESVENTIVGVFNDVLNIREIFRVYKDEIAAVIIEPVAGNMGVIKSSEEFLNELRKLCDENKTVLIFDEVMSGFRVSYKGAQDILKVKPDLITYAKIMGGGLPCGAYGGKREIMEKLSPMGPVYQAGTMSGNPVVMAAGLETLKKLYENPSIYEHLEKIGAKLEKGLLEIFKEKGIPVVINRVGAMLTIFFTSLSEVKTYEDVKTCDVSMFNSFFKYMLENGVYLPPSQFEALFLCSKHSEEMIDIFLEKAREFNYNYECEKK